MNIFPNLKRNMTTILGIASIAITIPFMCVNMNKAEATAHSHISHLIDTRQHLNTVGCCTNNQHSSMHIISADISGSGLPVPINNLGLFILAMAISLLFTKVYFPRNQTFSFLIGGTRLLRPPLLC